MTVDGRTLARLAMALACRVLPSRRRDWAAAMRAEAEAIEDDGEATRFAAGCLFGATRERIEHMLANPWRVARWSIAVALLALPAIAMQFTSEVNWDETDFIVMGAMLAVALLGYEFLASRKARGAYRAGAAIAIGASFLLVWANLAVGMIGSEDNPYNLAYFMLLLGGLVGAVVVRLRAGGMARVLTAVAVGQLLIAGYALATGIGSTSENWPRGVIAPNIVFALIWLLSAWLFRRAAAGSGPGRSGPGGPLTA